MSAEVPSIFSVGELDWTQVGEVRFALTNFLFSYALDRTGEFVSSADRLCVTLNDSDVVFEKVSEFDEVWSTVALGKETNVTCALSVDVGNQTREDVEALSYTICDLLTIGACQVINWIHYGACAHDGSLLYTCHQNRYTNRKTGSELIGFSDQRAAVAFLEGCYPAYQKYNARHPGLLHRVGRLLLDLSSPEFEQTSALVAVAIVDALSKQGSSDRDFRRRIEHLRGVYRVSLDDDDIDFFVKSRNSLVHEFTFRTKEATAEYFRIINILRKLLLGILDYRFEYYELTLGDHTLAKQMLQRHTP